MKRFYVLVMVALTVALSVTAQKKVAWMVEADAGFGMLSNMPRDSHDRFAYKIGGNVDIPLTRKFSLQPALLFGHNSTEVDGYFGNEQIMEAKYRVSLNYIELPLHAVFHIPISSNGTALFLKYGPYVAYGLQGKARITIPDSDYDESMPGNLFDDGCDFHGAAYGRNKRPFSLPAFKRWDYGLSARIGIESRHIAIGLGMTYGFANLTHTQTHTNEYGNLIDRLFTGNGSGKPRRYEFMLSLGYRIK